MIQAEDIQFKNARGIDFIVRIDVHVKSIFTTIL